MNNTRLLNTRLSMKDTESLPGVAGVIEEAIEEKENDLAHRWAGWGGNDSE